MHAISFHVVDRTAQQGHRGVLRCQVASVAVPEALASCWRLPCDWYAGSTDKLYAWRTACLCSTDFLLPVFVQVFQNWWLSVWSNATAAAEADGSHVATKMYMAVYFTFGMTSLVLQVGMLPATSSTSSKCLWPGLHHATSGPASEV